MGDSIIMNLDISMHVIEDSQSKSGAPEGGDSSHTGKQDRHPGGIMEVLRCFPNGHHRATIEKVEQVWRDIGFPAAEVEKRLAAFRDAFEAALTSVLSGGLDKQVSYKKTLDDRITLYERQIQENELFLEIPPCPSLMECCGTFDREIALRNRCNELNAMRGDRKNVLTSLIEANRMYSAALGCPELELPAEEMQLRTHFLEKFAEENTTLKGTFEDRTSEMELLRGRISAVCEEIRVPLPEMDWENLSLDNFSSAEEQLAQLIERKEYNVSAAKAFFERIKYLSNRIGLPSTFMDTCENTERWFDPLVVSQLREEKLRLEAEAQQNIRSLILKQRDAILSMYDQVYASDETRAAFGGFTSDDFTEELLDAHENELNQLRELHDNNRQIYSLLDDHKELMQKKAKFEEQESDPEIMKNRGGVLLKLQNEKKRVLKELSKVIQDLHAAVARVSTEQSPFLVAGKDLDTFLAHRQNALDAAKADHIKVKRGNNDPPSAMKRKGFNDTPTNKRLKDATGSAAKINATFMVAGKKGFDAADTTTVRNMGPVVRRINFTDKSSAQPDRRATPTSVTRPHLPAKVTTPRSYVAKR